MAERFFYSTNAVTLTEIPDNFLGHMILAPEVVITFDGAVYAWSTCGDPVLIRVTTTDSGSRLDVQAMAPPIDSDGFLDAVSMCAGDGNPVACVQKLNAVLTPQTNGFEFTTAIPTQWSELVE